MNKDQYSHDDIVNMLSEIIQYNEEMDQITSIASNISSTYTSLQHGMDISGITCSDLKEIISDESHNHALESLDPVHPSELLRSFVSQSSFAFALEGFLEPILLWNAWGQVAFICFAPLGIFIWCLAIADHIHAEAKILQEERKKLQDEGFYSPNANPNDWKGQEAMDDRALAKYKSATVKAYPAKQLLEELSASYDLMRIFTDTVANNTQIKPRQFVPALKKLGYVIDESNAKVYRDKSKAPKKGTIEELGYGDPSFIKHVFVKTDAHTELLPAFIKAMQKLKEEREKEDSVLEKVKRFFKVNSKEEVKPQDKITATLIIRALQATLEETEVLFKMSINLMSVLKKYSR